MRRSISLNGSWAFTKEALSPVEALEALAKAGNETALCAAEGGRFTAVDLPHTWNAADGQDGGNDYYRGKCLYVKALGTRKQVLGGMDRAVLEFLGASQTAEVFVVSLGADGQPEASSVKQLAAHSGPYSTFRTDITEALAEEMNFALVYVSNESSRTVYPQAADFTFYGGLYRGVNLIQLPKEHFEIIKDGTTGVKVTPQVNLEEKAASVLVESWQSGGEVTFEVAGMQKTVPSEEGYARAEFSLNPVRLWDGKRDPYLYTLTARLPGGDEVSARFGCRSFDMDPEKGFLLNGRPYPLRGVSRHQDRLGKGPALSLEDHQEDIDFIMEIGASTVRLAHYQHAQEFYDLCDEKGLVVWAEIPYITLHMEEARENTFQQMRELITQSYHHPSIVVWGLSNEISAASNVDEALLSNHRELNELCHRMDPTRKTTMAHVFMLEKDSPLVRIPDVASYNLYFGWYLGELTENEAFFDEFHAMYPDYPIGLAEYGADANPAYQSPEPRRSDYTESYQALYHEHMLDMIEKRPFLWATHVWNMFDFAADGRDEGGKHGVNQKGLVTMDRKLKKDAFYLYKAAWNKEEPFVHLCGRRYEKRHEAETEIKVYSNQSAVTLLVDGVKTAEQSGKTVFTFRVSLTGTHTIEAVSGEVKDTMTICRVDQPESAYQMAGGNVVRNWFDAEEIDPDYYSVNDTLGDLRSDPRSAAVVEAMMKKAQESRGDVAGEVTKNPMLQRILARMSLISLLSQGGASKEQVQQMNRVLQGIKKES